MTMAGTTAQEYFRATPEQKLLHLAPLGALPAAKPQLIHPEDLSALPLPPGCPGKPHLLVADASMRRAGSACVYHVCTHPLPPGSLLRVSESVATVSPALALVQRASRLSVPELIFAADELCGTYALSATEEDEMSTRAQPIATLAQLQGYVDAAGDMHGVKKARRALRYAIEGAASPRESTVEMLLCLPPLLGGFGLPRPIMNFEVEFDRAARQLTGHRCARGDLTWPKARLIVEVDSDAFHGQVDQLHRDQTRANALRHMGYEVMSITNNQLANLKSLTCLAADIAAALHWRIRTPSAKCLRARAELHSLLLYSSAGQHS